jgi:uncharacterized circularly permuted ATP-grasp superfamily protein
MFEGYSTNDVYDEMFVAPGTPRPHYASVFARLRALDREAFAGRRRMADVAFRNQGITFTV